MLNQQIALVDCNNFYCSCERIFNPKLIDLPIVVLSNNDGCIISRSDEAKALGIKMAAPVFPIFKELRQQGVKMFSSNYTLYADISRRVLSILEEFVPEIEVYSIDEAFLDLSLIPADYLEEFSLDLQSTILKRTGIPVGIGIGSSKTLAKIASHYGKKNKSKTRGVKSLINSKDLNQVLDWCKVNDIWGVGRASTLKLNSLGIITANDLKKSNPKLIRQVMTVTGERTVMELNGKSCIPLETYSSTRKGVASTRSFGSTVVDLASLSEAIASFIDRASFKLRKENLSTSLLQVFLRTDRHRTDQLQYNPAISIKLHSPSNDVSYLTKTSIDLLQRIFKPGYQYKKAGVYLLDLSAENNSQLDLFAHLDYQRKSSLMNSYDKLNAKYGRGTITTAAQHSSKDKSWTMNRKYLSPAYTTDWSQIPKARI